MKKELLLIFICLASAVFASYTVEPVAVKVSAGAKTTVTARITSEINDTYLIVPLRWSQWVFPSQYYVSIKSGETKTVPIEIIPFESANPGTYTLMINGYSVEKGQIYQAPVVLTVEKAYFVKFDKMYITGSFRPLGNVTVETALRNLGTKTFSGTVVRYVYRDGELLEKEETEVSIDPNDAERIRFQFSIPAGATGHYKVVLAALKDRKIFHKISDGFDVERVAILDVNERPLNIIFTKGKKIVVKNLGNVEKKYTNEINLNRFEEKVLSTNGVVEDGKIKWNVDVGPGETITLYYKINYVPYIILVITLVVVGWFALFKMKSLHVHKRIVKKDGSITVLIELDNTTGRTIKSITVKDEVIPIFKILPHRYGPLFKVKKKKNKFEVVWNIPSMSPGEQRILSYDIHEVIGVSGNIEFSPAEVSYKVGDKELRIHSNGCSVEMKSKIAVKEE